MKNTEPVLGGEDMKAYDVWLYAVTVEANSETEAIEKVIGALDMALRRVETEDDRDILGNIHVDFAELIGYEGSGRSPILDQFAKG